MSQLVENHTYFAKRFNRLLKTGSPRKVAKDDLVCRICLRKGNISITDYNTEYDVKEALFHFGNIQVSLDDPHWPKRLCKVCYQFLSIATLFRNVAVKSSDILKQTVCENTEIKASIVLKNEEVFIGEDKVEEDVDKIKANSNNESKNLVKSYDADSSNAKIFSDDESKDFMPSENEDSYITQDKTEIKDNFSEKITCEVCKKVVSRSYYKYHKTMHDPNHKFYQCDICGKSFRLRCAFYNHSLRHSKDFSYKCPHCPYQGKYKEVLKAHLRTHSQEQNYMCTECPAKFRYKGNLNKHVLRHKEPMIKCDKCSRAFHSKPDLKQHVEVDHLNIRSHVCSECSKAFGSRKGMMKHQKTVHKRKKMMTGRMPAYLQAQNNDFSSV